MDNLVGLLDKTKLITLSIFGLLFFLFLATLLAFSGTISGLILIFLALIASIFGFD